MLRYLKSQDVLLSYRKWQQIFREMNRNHKNPDKLSLSEFCLFIFPNNRYCIFLIFFIFFFPNVMFIIFRKAVEAEHRRLTKIKNRANRKSVAHVLELEKKLMARCLGRHTAKVPTPHAHHGTDGNRHTKHHLRVNLASPMDTFHLIREHSLRRRHLDNSPESPSVQSIPNLSTKNSESVHITDLTSDGNNVETGNNKSGNLFLRKSTDFSSEESLHNVLHHPSLPFGFGLIGHHENSEAYDAIEDVTEENSNKLSLMDLQAIERQKEPSFDPLQLPRNQDNVDEEIAETINNRIIADFSFQPLNQARRFHHEQSEMVDDGQTEFSGRPLRNQAIRLPPLPQTSFTIFNQINNKWGGMASVHPVVHSVIDESDEESDEVEEVKITEVYQRSSGPSLAQY